MPCMIIRSRRLPWSELLRRVYKLDLTVCSNCKGLLTIIAFITDAEVVCKILTHLKLPTQSPVLEPEHFEEQLELDFDDDIYDTPLNTDTAVCHLQQQRAPPSVEWVN